MKWPATGPSGEAFADRPVGARQAVEAELLAATVVVSVSISFESRMGLVCAAAAPGSPALCIRSPSQSVVMRSHSRHVRNRAA